MINYSPPKSANVVYLDRPTTDIEVTINAENKGGLRRNSLLPSGLAAHLNRCWARALNEKNTAAQERLLRCERQRRGVYDPDKAQEIADTGGSNIYMLITDVKCRAAESWSRSRKSGRARSTA